MCTGYIELCVCYIELCVCIYDIINYVLYVCVSND